jgi:hypothetical protein
VQLFGAAIMAAFAGQLFIEGAVLSLTVTLKLQLAVLPPASWAVSVTVVDPSGKKSPEFLVPEIVTPEQLSLPVADHVTVVPVQFPGSRALVILPGQFIVGFSVSITITSKLQLAVLPPASWAVKITVVVPNGKKSPGFFVPEIVTPGQLSVAEADQVTVAPVQLPGSADLVILEGQVIAGISGSVTVTVKLQVALLPALSVAV